MKKKSNTKRIIITAAVVVIMIAAAVFGMIQYKNAKKQAQKKENEQTYKDLQEQVVAEPEQSEDDAEDNKDIAIDFSTLQAMNPDIYAWIYIPDTEISYPIVQSDEADQSYYLNHTVQGALGMPGSIYSENVNKKDFTDFNTILYGHEMIDGSMFGSLKSYRDISFWETHPEIYVYTPEKKFTFRIFAAVVFDDRYIPEAYDFSKVQDMGQYISDIQSVQGVNSHVFEEAVLDTNSKLLTLSTCIADQSTNRYLVEAYLVNE
ncbi:MAG: class B sortase [Hespellia sp.]|nr:class B sortase [Hespellia sp.]